MRRLFNGLAQPDDKLELSREQVLLVFVAELIVAIVGVILVQALD